MNRPFDEAKFEALLKGLDRVSIVSLSDLETKKRRIDSEFYHPSFLRLQNKIDNLSPTRVVDLGVQLDCSAFYPSITGDYNFEKSGVPFLRVNEIQDGLVTLTDKTAFLPEKVLEDNKTTIASAKPFDIVIAKGGNTLAKLGLITEEYPTFALSRDLLLLQTSQMRNCNKYFLWVFLHSRYGQSLLWRTASQTGQPHLTLAAIGDIGLPRFSGEFEGVFEAIYQKSQRCVARSKQLFAESGDLLVNELNFIEVSRSIGSKKVIELSSSFAISGRLDAEYYQPRYDYYRQVVENYPNGWSKISDVCSLNESNFTPDEDTMYKYIELSDVGKYGEIGQILVEQGRNLPGRARRRVVEGEVLISSIEGSLESCAIIDAEHNGSVCSNGFFVLRSERINSETLLVLFKSKFMQGLLKQCCTGTILTAINKADFVNIPVPIIGQDVQESISVKVKDSLSWRQTGKTLLEIAKTSVEIAIDTNEQTAWQFLKDQNVLDESQSLH
ncbi:hypothetical protein FEM33_25225 [Dyadobacter flavalbus]|uniref:Restriction endonuclease subunit S n=1 Tax=Dyadobacter flavalbus TaxID=2579942 RepID=A0A5M8Q8Y8_9BACT|nr:restriction endonuclease subunit S [Dyadobacter flavalbus]KAA6431608.1 hypothetical protein FEM33_25225 [Dyadobacter flavalbus]